MASNLESPEHDPAAVLDESAANVEHGVVVGEPKRHYSSGMFNKFEILMLFIVCLLQSLHDRRARRARRKVGLMVVIHFSHQLL